MGKDILSREELKIVNQNIKPPSIHRKQILPLFILNFFPICIFTVHCIKSTAYNIPFKNNNICRAVMAHTFNPSTPEAEAGRSL